MALLPKKANTEGNNEGLGDMTPIPAGDYIAQIVKSEFKQTKAKNGHYLALQWKILDGEKKGRLLFSNLNLDNPNPVAVEIANKELNSISQAAGKVGVEDSQELHEIPVCLTVIIRQGDANYPPSNEIRGYKKANMIGDTPIPTKTAETGTGSGATNENAGAAGAVKLPWEK